MVRRASVALSLALLCLLAACRVDVTVDVVVGADGNGEVVVTAVADAEVVQQAPGLAGDLQFDDAVTAGWAVEGPTATADGGLTVTLRHPVTSAEEATNLLNSLGPPFTTMRLERNQDPGSDGVAVVLSGQLTLPNGFDSFADSDLLGAVGGTPFGEQIAVSGATPASSMSVTLRADLPGEVLETSGQEADGRLVWAAPLDGSSSNVAATTEQRPPSGGGWAGPASTILLVLLVAWVVAATAFIVSVARARRRRARRRTRSLDRLGRL